LRATSDDIPMIRPAAGTIAVAAVATTTTPTNHDGNTCPAIVSSAPLLLVLGGSAVNATKPRARAR
jgi:hypothetical protein